MAVKILVHQKAKTFAASGTHGCSAPPLQAGITAWLQRRGRKVADAVAGDGNETKSPRVRREGGETTDRGDRRSQTSQITLAACGQVIEDSVAACRVVL